MAENIVKKDFQQGRYNKLGILGWIYAGKYWIERYAYLVHRITGLALIFYLILHIHVVGARAKGQAAWEAMMAKISGEGFKFLELLLMIAFIVHALNGFRLILIELGLGIGKPTRPKFPYRTSINSQKPIVYLIMLFGAIFIAISIVEFYFAGEAK